MLAQLSHALADERGPHGTSQMNHTTLAVSYLQVRNLDEAMA